MEQDFELVFTLPHFNSENGIGNSSIRDGTILDLAGAYSCGNVERSKRKNDNDLNQSESLRNRPRGQTSWAEPNPTGLGVNELWSKGIPAQSQCPFFSGATQRQESATSRLRGRVVGWTLTSRNIYTIFSGGIKILFSSRVVWTRKKSVNRLLGDSGKTRFPTRFVFIGPDFIQTQTFQTFEGRAVNFEPLLFWRRLNGKINCWIFWATFFSSVHFRDRTNQVSVGRDRR